VLAIRGRILEKTTAKLTDMSEDEYYAFVSALHRELAGAGFDVSEGEVSAMVDRAGAPGRAAREPGRDRRGC
jgi:hypothetical protein